MNQLSVGGFHHEMNEMSAGMRTPDFQLETDHIFRRKFLFQCVKAFHAGNPLRICWDGECPRSVPDIAGFFFGCRINQNLLPWLAVQIAHQKIPVKTISFARIVNDASGRSYFFFEYRKF